MEPVRWGAICVSEEENVEKEWLGWRKKCVNGENISCLIPGNSLGL